ncbi:protein translocase subunit SecD [Alicyclobacillus ferrooxydans]|uniref:Protein translocase subunit SecD n=1 Tax=Alicyclobacillus ferrooxydans TaxID=471514 RepID=A0A0N8PNR7_9BACL|nr:protein translocase subunit SecD [Alicyclobacillus ferrooxydans]KPV42277.1 preprotein translocase subunit SecD [Alicyclobacillus ferrooxydans]
MKKTKRNWGRFFAFLLFVVVILGLTGGTSVRLWKTIPLGLDLKGGMDLLYQIEATPSQPLTKTGIDAALQAVELRVNSLGVSSPQIELEGKDFIRVDLAGNFNQQQYTQVIGTTADLKFYGQATQNKNGTWTPDPKTLLASGKDLKSNSKWAQDPQTGNNVVTLDFKDPALWQSITTKYLQKPVYIFLNGSLLSAPKIDSVMSNGQSEIYGPGLTTPQECITLAHELNAGALPYPLKLVSSMNVGPSLGMSSLKATMIAGLAAIIVIFLFMLSLYRLAGLIADVALVAYLYLVLVTFSGLHVVLTLSGLAALILGVGMAVDANIITYERIKDEVRNGKSLQSSVVAGNKRALRTIIDSNATTFIAGAVMYWFGQGDIRGFAISLMLSIVISLITAVLLSRVMLLLFTKSNVVGRPWWFGIGKGVVQK